jgi:asparagine synthase (glutamine-hydrolysing)
MAEGMLSNYPSLSFSYAVIVKALEESVKRNLTDGLLLSGGLDTALLAWLALRYNKPSCITVAMRGAPTPDVGYARLVATRLKLEHHIHYFGDDELNEGLRCSIKVMKSFDPMEIRNSAAIYIALKAGKKRGLATFMTGDGADELFGGYSFLFGLARAELEAELKKLWANMRFASVPLARELGVEAKLPFLEPRFRALAQNLDVRLKVKSEGGRVWGKWVLRKASEKILPREIAWRAKAPIEGGTGTTILPWLFDSKITDAEFGKKKAKYLKQDGVTIRDKEHLAYYEVYRELIGLPSSSVGDRRCPQCGAGVDEKATFCRTCGAYPI